MLSKSQKHRFDIFPCKKHALGSIPFGLFGSRYREMMLSPQRGAYFCISSQVQILSLKTTSSKTMLPSQRGVQSRGTQSMHRIRFSASWVDLGGLERVWGIEGRCLWEIVIFIQTCSGLTPVHISAYQTNAISQKSCSRLGAVHLSAYRLFDVKTTSFKNRALATAACTSRLIRKKTCFRNRAFASTACIV